MQKDEIGGSALKNGLFLIGPSFKVTGLQTRSGIDFKTVKLKPSLIPVVNWAILRGIVVGWPFILLFYLFFRMPSASRIVVLLSFLAFIVFTLNKSTREYHGAEHKVINTFINDLDITNLMVLRQSSMICRRCGSTFLILVAVVATIMAILVSSTPMPVWLAAILVPGIAYELHIADNISWIVRQIVTVALAIQGKCVEEPSDDKLMLASQTLSKLLELEQEQDTFC